MSNYGSPGYSQLSNSSLQEIDMPAPPGTSSSTNSPMSYNSPQTDSKCSTPDLTAPKIQISTKGVENAKKRLRAFSIQKKAPLPQPSMLPKLSSGTGNTVLIGKLCSAKVSVKPTPDQDEKKPPRPPKPGSSNKRMESYMEVKRKTLAEIEDMKRKMELVELGIPLGLICPPTHSNDSILPTKAMPTKAMPPIKSFLDAEQVDRIIREAKQAKAEGKEFKFDYQKLLPDYDNPFQRKKEDIKDDSEVDKTDKFDRSRSYSGRSDDDRKYREKEWRKSSKRDLRRHSDLRSKHESHFGHKKDEKHGDSSRSKDRNRDKEEKRAKADEEVDKEHGKYGKVTTVDLKGFVVCDSWSPSDKTCSPIVDENTTSLQESIHQMEAVKEQIEQAFKEEANEKVALFNDKAESKTRTPIPDVKTEPPKKIGKLPTLMDSFTYEIDVDDEVALDMFDEMSDIKKFAKAKRERKPDNTDEVPSKETAVDVTAEDFLESVLNELKHEADDIDKGLVEYELSPEKNEETPNPGTPERSRSGTATPEIKAFSSQRSNFSESSFRSDAGYKSTESGYKSAEPECLRLVDADESVVDKMTKSTIDSLETWSFVLKICQPLLFRHDRNKCYKETQADPKVWYAANPKLCNCVRDRSVVYEELETCKMGLVDRVYGCDQLSDSAFASKREWYRPLGQCFQETKTIQLSSEWETEDSQLEEPVTPAHVLEVKETLGDVSLDQEYQRFMDAVWPEISEDKASRSTTPTKGDVRKKAKSEKEEKKKKKTKLNSESWSTESDVEEDDKSGKKSKMKERGKKRKRNSTSSNISETTDGDEAVKKTKKKLSKKKTIKKNKAKFAKRRRLEKKYLKKLKEKQRKKTKKLKDKTDKIDIDSEDSDDTEKSKKKKKQQQKLKKKDLKRKKSSSSSSSSTSDDDSEPEKKKRNKKRTEDDKIKKKKRKDRKKRRKQSSSESTQDEGAFDVNILNNIKTEKLTDDEKAQKKLADIQDFSPRRQQNKPRQQIIDMKELQNDLEISNMHIKREKVESETAEDSFDYHFDPESVAVESSSLEQIEVELPKESPVARPDEASRASSQESTKAACYEKDESHLRPASQNSNYSFHDVPRASQPPYYEKPEPEEPPEPPEEPPEYHSYEHYEQLAMEYQSGVAQQQPAGGAAAAGDEAGAACRIETVVSRGGRGGRGEIKCDWRAGDEVRALSRPSRWGLKPGEANIVLTGSRLGEGESPVYKIRSVLEPEPQSYQPATGTGYDEAYADMYGAADRLQYGDCFLEARPPSQPPADPPGPPLTPAGPHEHKRSSLDVRIDRVLTDTQLTGVPNTENRLQDQQDEKGILTKPLKAELPSGARVLKRVSFADGYKPGQDSDTEEPPVKRRKRGRRVGCAWPCPATHPDHVPLWDALPPPPPPPGSPPPPAPPPPPLLLPPPPRRPHPARDQLPLPPPHHHYKFDPSSMPMAHMMPPEPPPGLLNLNHLSM